MNESDLRLNDEIDLRRSPRYPATDVPARLALQPLRLIDLGDTGARIETSAWLAPGRRCMLTIGDLPLPIGGRIVRSRVIRVEPAPDGLRPVFEAGIEFDASPAGRPQLEALMARLAARGSDQELPAVGVAYG
jgi:hypothetical protein